MGGRLLELSQCEADVSVWRIRDKSIHEIKGTIGVYVDVLLVLAEEKELKLKPALDAIRSTWKCAEPAFATNEGGFTLYGVELSKGFRPLHPSDEVRYAHIKPTGQLPEFKQESAEEVPTPEKVQYAQKAIGELTWVWCRMRLDVAFVVNRLSRYAVGHPCLAAECGEQILGYLFHTSGVNFDMEFTNLPRTPLKANFRPPAHQSFSRYERKFHLLRPIQSANQALSSPSKTR